MYKRQNEMHALKIGKKGNEFVVFTIGKRGGKDYEGDTYVKPTLVSVNIKMLIKFELRPNLFRVSSSILTHMRPG